jgi:hypothetical protein
MNSKNIARIFGVCIGIVLVNWGSGLLIPASWRTSLPKYSDPAKQEFVTTFIATFEAENPETEDWDRSNKSLPNSALKDKHYSNFDKLVKKIYPTGCPVRRIVVESKYMNEDAKNREFVSFDAENCKIVK